MNNPEAKWLKPGRLPDVLKLIDELGRRDDLVQRSEPGLNGTIGRPTSDDWTTIVRDHEEFFENVGGDNPLVLRRRYRLPGRRPLTADEIEQLHAEAKLRADGARSEPLLESISILGFKFNTEPLTRLLKRLWQGSQ